MAGKYMQAKPQIPGSPQDWLCNARSDLILAGLRKTKYLLYTHLCFHAQQAAEKSIKSVLIDLNIPFSRTHDLAYLLDLLPHDISIPPSLIDLPILNKYAVQQRYPGDLPPVTAKHRRSALQMATDAVTWATNHLNRNS